MTEQSFRGHVRAMRADAEWFGAEDLLDLGDVPLKIEDVMHDPVLKIGGATSNDKHYLILSDKAGRKCAKKMVINAHRRKALGAMYGGQIANWIGKWVWVFVDTVKAPQGGMTLGMRFRARTDAPKQEQGQAK